MVTEFTTITDSKTNANYTKIERTLNMVSSHRQNRFKSPLLKLADLSVSLTSKDFLHPLMIAVFVKGVRGVGIQNEKY